MCYEINGIIFRDELTPSAMTCYKYASPPTLSHRRIKYYYYYYDCRCCEDEHVAEIL